MIRPSKRNPEQIRTVSFTRNYTKHAEGSVLVCFGDTHVLCNASVENRVPAFLRNSGRGWVTAEYSMLPRSTHSRMQREVIRGKQSGRSAEIQRLIGRSLRAAIDTKAIGERTITIDCDVIQADGGTRTASITGAYIALHDAVSRLMKTNGLDTNPMQRAIASVSVGIYQGEVVADLDYAEDSQADTDMNLVLDDSGHYIEIQGTAENQPFSREKMNRMFDYAEKACAELFTKQKQCLESAT